MNIQGSVRAYRTAVAAIILVGAPPLRANPPDSDAHALNTIFGDEYLAANVLETCSQATKLSPEDRYQFLANWVLPGDRHPGFRVIADFSPTYPAPTSGYAETVSGFRVPSGGEIVSPAVDLIDTAASLDRLDELRRRIEATTAKSVDDRIDQLALLALVDTARDNLEPAQSNLSSLFALLLSEGTVEPLSSDAVLLCVDAAAGQADVSRAVVEPAYQIVASYQGVVERSIWQRQFSAAFARVRERAGWNAENSNGPASRLARWYPASVPRARYRGAGGPAALWNVRPGRADNMTSHDEDFLYFALPLRGSFEVEGDFTGFRYRRSQLLLAGKWVGTVSNHKLYDLGEIDGSMVRFPVDPPMTNVDDFIHVRTVVRNGMETTYVNGRRMHDQPLSDERDPWVAVHSAARYPGGVRDLRITGDPEVPATVPMTSGPGLTGWVPYFEEPDSDDWRLLPGRSSPPEIQARRRQEFPRGCFKESALFYHRPMLEDGSIDYEFWYQPGVCEVHPALDRLCFLLEPDGVNVHWLTDGPYDRTESMPDQLIDEPGNRRGPAPLPLHERDWNRLRLTVHGDTVDLALNGELVYQRNIEATNQRHFGLFHYSDRTALRVRNVTWRGDWPRTIPGLDAQELAVDEAGFLDDRLPELTAVYSHKFTDGLPLDRVSLREGELPAHFTVARDGLHAIRNGSGDGYISATVAPNLSVSGDFDITAAFDQLVTDTTVNGSSNISLMAVAETADECLLLRRRIRHRGRDQQLLQCSRVRRGNDATRRSFFAQHLMEAPGGTLRLARRGETVYYLFAENDSPNFRLIGRESFPAADLPLHGVRLRLQTHGDDGLTSVVWKNLTVRAESLAGPALNPDHNSLEDLNRERDRLAQSVSQDFTTAPPDEALIRRWTDLREWNAADNGLLIVAPGTDSWTSAGAALQRRIEGDFDIAVRFEPQRLDIPAEGLNSSVYLQVKLEDGGATQLSLIFEKLDSDVSEVLVQLSTDDGGAGRNYRFLGRLGVSLIQGLRLARRGRQITCIALSKQLGGEVIFAQADVGDAPIDFDSTRILVHAGGAGRESRVVWKSLDVRADRLSSTAR